jgi:hypothetical protein
VLVYLHGANNINGDTLILVYSQTLGYKLATLFSRLCQLYRFILLVHFISHCVFQSKTYSKFLGRLNMGIKDQRIFGAFNGRLFFTVLVLMLSQVNFGMGKFSLFAEAVSFLKE